MSRSAIIKDRGEVDRHLEHHNLSITPLTLQEIDFEPVCLGESRVPIYTETYSYAENSVKRFAIKESEFRVRELSETIFMVGEGEYSQEFNVEELRKSIAIPSHIQGQAGAGAGGSGAASASSASSKSSRSSKRAESVSLYKKYPIKVEYHKVEIDILQEAISHLLKDETTKTVLVDIFARDNGVIRYSSDSFKVETHTIILFKNQFNEGVHNIAVIDPSSSYFSRHLSSEDLRAKLADVPKLGKIAVYEKLIEIYKPGSSGTSASDDSYRDCVDIAVKLALGFNREPKDFEVVSTYEDRLKLENNSLPNNKVVIQITNNDKIDRSIINDQIVMRLKQKSDYKAAEVFSKIQKSLKYLFDLMKVSSVNHDRFEVLEHVKHYKMSTKEDLVAFDLINQGAYLRFISHLEEERDLPGNVKELFEDHGGTYE